MGNGTSAESVRLITDNGTYVQGHFDDLSLRDNASVVSYNTRTGNQRVREITFRAWKFVSQCLDQQRKCDIDFSVRLHV